MYKIRIWGTTTIHVMKNAIVGLMKIRKVENKEEALQIVKDGLQKGSTKIIVEEK